MNHAIAPLLTVPPEVLCEIAKYLPRHSVSYLQRSCHGLEDPMRAYLMRKYKNLILLHAAETNQLSLLSVAIAARADLGFHEDGSCRMFHRSLTALHYSASKGHDAITVELLRHGAPIEALDASRFTPLLLAARLGREGAVNLLVAAGADTTTPHSGKSALLLAALTSGLEQTATAFISQMDQMTLHYAIRMKRLSIVRLMFSRGIATTVEPPLHLAASIGLPYVKLCLDNGALINGISQMVFDGTALSVAVTHGHMAIVKYLLRMSADINAGPKKSRPMMIAVRQDNIEMVRLFLDHDVDLAPPCTDQADVLAVACERASAEVVELLLDSDQGLNVNGRGKNDRKPGPLHIAATHANVDVIRLLLDRGADIDARRGPNRQMPIHCAAKAASKKAVVALLEEGADPMARCGQITPLMMANNSSADEKCRGKTMAALVRGGADINELGKKSRAMVNKVMKKGR